MAKPGPKPGSKRKNTAGMAKRPTNKAAKSVTNTDTQAAPKRRGRPPKSASKPAPDSAPATSPVTSPAAKRRGRPPKAKAEHSQQHHNQEPEQAQSSHVQPQEAVVLEVVGTSIQPAFVIQEHGVNSPDLAHAQDRPTDEPQGILSKLPSKKEVATAKKLAVKKTQTMKKTATKKVPDAMLAYTDTSPYCLHYKEAHEITRCGRYLQTHSMLFCRRQMLQQLPLKQQRKCSKR